MDSADDQPTDGLADIEIDVVDRALTSEELEDLTASEDTPSEVTFSGQDFDIAGLVRRLQTESMLIPRLGTSDTRVDTQGFQRGFVWSKAQMDRFVESLLLGYPVPAIFLVRQVNDNRMLVLDGQQRLETLRRFYEGEHNGKTFALANVAREFKGLTYNTLPEALRFKLDDSYMQATIVAADGSTEVNDAIYQIFERLNSGGTQLTPHEIRVALAAGPLIAYLEDLNSDPAWRALYGPRSRRIRDQELVLRIIALYVDSDNYSRPLKTFLNNFASNHRDLDDQVTRAGDLFLAACKMLAETVGPEALRRPGVGQVNVAQAEALIVGLMTAIARGDSPTDIRTRINELQFNKQFIDATTRATADNDSVNLRLQMAKRAFEQ